MPVPLEVLAALLADVAEPVIPEPDDPVDVLEALLAVDEPVPVLFLVLEVAPVPEPVDVELVVVEVGGGTVIVLTVGLLV